MLKNCRPRVFLYIGEKVIPVLYGGEVVQFFVDIDEPWSRLALLDVRHDLVHLNILHC